MDTIKEKLRKILALAENGSEGEKQAAQARLDALMQKYGVGLDDIADEEQIHISLDRDNELEYRLMRQVLSYVMENDFGKCEVFTSKRSETEIIILLPKSKAVEMEFLYGEYRKLMADELEVFFGAFVMKHDIYGGQSNEEPTEEEIQTYRKQRRMAQHLSDANLARKRLAGAG